MDRGRVVFSADEIATKITDSDPRIRSGLRRIFGPLVFTPQGKLDRRRVASAAFGDKARLRELNALVHPKVITLLHRKIRQLPISQRHPYVIVESALIYEARLEEMFDFILLVHSPLNQRIARVRAQKGMSRNEVLRRVTTQILPSKAEKKADFTLGNTGSMSDLARSVVLLDNIFTTLAAGKSQKPTKIKAI
jgi:dephospho-CoA kinase